jgi:hypothetical protein
MISYYTIATNIFLLKFGSEKGMFKKFFICCALVLSVSGLYPMEQKTDSLYNAFHQAAVFAQGYQANWYPQEFESLLRVSEIAKKFNAVETLLKQYDSGKKNPQKIDAMLEALIGVLEEYSAYHEDERAQAEGLQGYNVYDYPEYASAAKVLLERVLHFKNRYFS